ncbi:MAG: amino acid ABC transporter ATP-binding protein [Lachnospiraceae bacterium]|nr:amino acid ABC transporter ATP-binding protein [Lachnospiraceae bacterium]
MMEDRNTLVEFKDVCKTYKNGEIVILDHFNFDFLQGETHVICGRSGAGKSTLIRCINYLEKIDSGEILVEGNTVNRHTATSVRKRIAMVFQNFNLFPNMTALENVTFGPIESLHKSKKEVVESGKMFLEKVGLADRMDSKPSQLSGGQQQRVAIARALNMFPDMILFDEPTSALDPEMVGEVIDIMEELADEKRSMIVVTHEMGFAREAAHRISFMENGTFIETADPNEFFNHPKHESVARFIRQIQTV